MTMKKITSEEELRALLGKPHAMTQQKIYDHLNDRAQDFINRSPLFFIASYGSQGGATVSPKGDAPGLINIIDQHTLIIPDRPGNKLLHGHSNILQTGQIGLIFLIPGTEETLRINGSAELFTDDALSQTLKANGKPALLLIQVTIEQCFFHCAKAFKRSQAWHPEAWPEPFHVSFGKEIAGNSKKGGKIAAKATEMVVEQAVKADYKFNL
jgi:PPOX class probable FMN-dependent enzyme